MNKPLLVILSVIALPVVAFELEHHETHVHGLTEMTLAADNGLVEISMDSPLANFVGFEYKAKNAEQQAELDSTLAILNQPEKLFTFHGGQCVLKNKTVGLEYNEENEGHHQGIEANYQFTCLSESLDALDVLLQDYFPGIHNLEFSWLVDNVAGQSMLENTQRTVRFNK